MLRYFAIATVIVVGVFVAVGAWWLHRPHKPLKVASVNASPFGPHYALPSPGARRSVPATVTAQWVLSALPECLQQLAITRGPMAFVRAHLPADAVAVPVQSRLQYGDCTLRYDGSSIRVRRGEDNLTVPPVSTLYTSGGKLYVLHHDHAGNQLREYGRSNIP